MSVSKYFLVVCEILMTLLRQLGLVFNSIVTPQAAVVLFLDF